MAFMNVFHNGYKTLALVALIISLHSGQFVTGKEIQCSYHFGLTRTDARKASCMQNAFEDNLCWLTGCTLDGQTVGSRGWNTLLFDDCTRGGVGPPTDGIEGQQYFRRSDEVEVEGSKTKGWWTCPFSTPVNKQTITCHLC
ncbi:hypothetical protein PGT21_024807 [Puccinia graminis f. sp. tritici]|uniref:Cyanovirin-N domain-containing protein n=1 Tax=Puccinia graminis f. sp. tritici TaxID=56615 RepID=A0A5B0NV84_PUCGR|nr:hypothetical protein PGT21_024807 [Puccinia graminis f. sp. tritici]KAA1127722.1 hypothetical protein PGTUg99_004070 [Puccinia graminis f. sp. tritici]